MLHIDTKSESPSLTTLLRRRIDSKSLGAREALGRRTATAEWIKAAEGLRAITASPINIARACTGCVVADTSLRAVIRAVFCWSTLCETASGSFPVRWPQSSLTLSHAQLPDFEEGRLARRAVKPRVPRVADAEPAAPVAVSVLPRSAVVLPVLDGPHHPRAALFHPALRVCTVFPH